MAGHSQFKNIMHRKGAQDAKRAKLFNKLAREITVASKSGMPDPAANPRLRLAIQAARVQNMPRDRIDRAIKQGQPGGDDAIYEEVRYEGYGPGGVAVIVEALTDNRNRTAAEVRSAFAKNGGSLAETGAVSFMFDRVGQLVYPAAVRDADGVLEAALDAGADDVVSEADSHTITTGVESFAAVRDALQGSLGDPDSGGLVWRPQNLVPVADDPAQSLLKMIDILEDSDDVQTVTVNAELSDELVQRLSA